MPPQEVHEPLVVRVRQVEEPDELTVTAVRLLKPTPDDVFNVGARDQALRVRACDRVPEVLNMKDVDHGRSCAVWQNDVAFLDVLACSGVHGAFDDVFELTNVPGKVIELELRDRFTGDLLAPVEHAVNQERNIVGSASQRWYQNREDAEAIEKVFA